MLSKDKERKKNKVTTSEKERSSSKTEEGWNKWIEIPWHMPGEDEPEEE